MLPWNKFVLIGIACCVTVASAAEPRFLFGGSGLHLFAGGSSGGHESSSYSGAGGSGRPTGDAGGRRPTANGDGRRPEGNGGGRRPESNGGGVEIHMANVGGGSHSNSGAIGGDHLGNNGILRPAVNGGGESHSVGSDDGSHSIGSGDASHSIGSGDGSQSGGGAGGTLGGGLSTGQFGGYQQESYPLQPYNFSYAVSDQYSGVNFGHIEQSDGQNVRGQYRVLLPDGRTQIVTYTANWRTGYNADVQYMGEARYPQPSSNNSDFGRPSSGNELPSSGHRQPFGNNNDSHSGSDPSSGSGQSFSGNGRPSNIISERYRKGPPSSYDPLAQSSGYGK